MTDNNPDPHDLTTARGEYVVTPQRCVHGNRMRGCQECLDLLKSIRPPEERAPALEQLDAFLENRAVYVDGMMRWEEPYQVTQGAALTEQEEARLCRIFAYRAQELGL